MDKLISPTEKKKFFLFTEYSSDNIITGMLNWILIQYKVTILPEKN